LCSGFDVVECIASVVVGFDFDPSVLITQCDDGGSVGVAELPFAGSFVWRDDFVSGGDDAEFDLFVDGWIGDPESGEHAHDWGGDDPSCAWNSRACGHVFAYASDVHAGLERLDELIGEFDAAGEFGDIFAFDDDMNAIGNGGSGDDL